METLKNYKVSMDEVEKLLISFEDDQSVAIKQLMKEHQYNNLERLFEGIG